MFFDMLCRLVRHAVQLPDVEQPLLHDNEPEGLIKDFSQHFIFRIYVFKNAAHVFDRETFVEKVLQGARRTSESRAVIPKTS